MLLQNIILALASIARHKLRSLLTLLGIIIGVAAVIAMLTVGNGARDRITGEVAELGGNLISVWAQYVTGDGSFVPRQAPALRMRDFEPLMRNLRDSADVIAISETSGQAIFGPRSADVTIIGVSEAYAVIRNWRVTEGRPLERWEIASGAGVCLIGAQAAKTLFAGESPLRARIRIGPAACTVVGVLASRGATLGGSEDKTVLLPLENLQARIEGSRNLSSILIMVREGVSAGEVMSRAKESLRLTRRIVGDQNDDFMVEDNAELIRHASRLAGILTAFLGSVAGISLLVGGIGIMNIMLVSVAERTREIGVRMAIGARPSDILLQFIVEASAMALLGGAIGIGLGLLIAFITTALIDLPFAPDAVSIAAIALLSMLIGLVFGFFPALRGARLDPIEALRHE
ncbi:ABC transporter permease [Nitratireductor indicus]|uniref:ABC transporter permease n=1 Tax=Nitratireductor indicus TaxID=721133 RepID=UPI00287560A0|nr:ABC transporter permease [Nitratireductor indicus]MDS1135662.1 ABC transporter permease [Nitratireductor indicus]